MSRRKPIALRGDSSSGSAAPRSTKKASSSDDTIDIGGQLGGDYSPLERDWSGGYTFSWSNAALRLLLLLLLGLGIALGVPLWA